MLTVSRRNKKEEQTKQKRKETMVAWKRKAQEVQKTRDWNTEDEEMRKAS
jgi:hypothetical protein